MGCILLSGIGYAVIVRYTSFRIPCFFRLVTGLRCPGCGITHLIYYLMRLDPRSAMQENIFLFTTSPLLLLLCILHIFPFRNPKIRYARWLNVITILYLIALLIWFVVRNLLAI